MSASDSEYESDFENEQPLAGATSTRTTVGTGSSLGAEEAVRGALQASVAIICKEGSSLGAEAMVSGAIYASARMFCQHDEDGAYMGKQQGKLLKYRPPTKDKSCGKKGAMLAALTAIDLSTVPHCDKLAIHRKTPLDMIKDQFTKPHGSVPPTALPTWFEIDMAKKIPMVPSAKVLFYSRGKLGKPLLRCHPGFYTIYDQRNQERVIKAPYTALHDHHAKNYLYKPSVKKLLKKQGLINSHKDVICSLRDFNDFRRYLGTHFYDEVGKAVKKRDDGWLKERKQWLRIHRYLSNTGGRQAFLNSRRARARALLRADQKNRLRQFRERKKKADAQLMLHRAEKERQQAERIRNGKDRDAMAKLRLENLKMQRLLWRRSVLKTATMKDIAVDERKKARIANDRAATIQFKVAWLDVKFESALTGMDREHRLEEALRIEHQAKALKRQQKVERMRELIPETIRRKRAEKERLTNIVRKFAMRWLNKIRERLHAPKDQLHESVWIGKSKGVLDDTLKYLKELSGYEKMDDFVLNILKMKAQIKKQIELEEAAEEEQSDGTGETKVEEPLDLSATATGAEPPSAPLSGDESEPPTDASAPPSDAEPSDAEGE